MNSHALVNDENDVSDEEDNHIQAYSQKDGLCTPAWNSMRAAIHSEQQMPVTVEKMSEIQEESADILPREDHRKDVSGLDSFISCNSRDPNGNLKPLDSEFNLSSFLAKREGGIVDKLSDVSIGKIRTSNLVSIVYVEDDDDAEKIISRSTINSKMKSTDRIDIQNQSLALTAYVTADSGNTPGLHNTRLSTTSYITANECSSEIRSGDQVLEQCENNSPQKAEFTQISEKKSPTNSESDLSNAREMQQEISQSSCCGSQALLFIEAIDTDDELHNGLKSKGEEAFTRIHAQSTLQHKGYERIYNAKKADHKLQIHFSSYTTPEKNKVNKVICEYYVPATPRQFIEFLNNVDEQWKLDDGNMEKFYPRVIMEQTNSKGFILYYLAYKKMLIASARDLVYLKHYKQIEEDVWADASVSVEYPDLLPNKGKVRCEMKGSGHMVKLVSGKEDRKPVSFVRMYSESDFKTNVPGFMAKSFTQSSMKSYVEKTVHRLEVLYPYSL